MSLTRITLDTICANGVAECRNKPDKGGEPDDNRWWRPGYGGVRPIRRLLDGAAGWVSGTSWSYTITGLVAGANGITVTATDAAGNTAMATGSITLDTVAPPVSMNAVTSPTKVTSQTITGTVGEDSTVSVATNTAASDGPAVVTGTTWSYTITGLVEGEMVSR